MIEIAGKNAIVTGASKGIGLEIVKILLDKGVNVAGWSRSGVQLDHDHFKSFQVDISDEEAVKAGYKHSRSWFQGEVHFLINNAGYGQFGTFEEMNSEDWESMFQTNVHGLFYVTKCVIPGMKSMDYGHIINISSIAGKNPVKNAVCYSATKHAVTGLSHSLFMEVRDFGIKVSCVYPGSVQTTFFDDISQIEANDNMMHPADVAKSVVELLNTSANYLPVEIEMRPLRPKGKPSN